MKSPSLVASCFAATFACYRILIAGARRTIQRDGTRVGACLIAMYNSRQRVDSQEITAGLIPSQHCLYNHVRLYTCRRHRKQNVAYYNSRWPELMNIDKVSACLRL